MLNDIYQRYHRELFESVVPFWTRYSLDREAGGYFTCLNREGAVYDTRKYVWLQGRAIWTFSRLYNEFEQRQEWLEAAAHGVDFLKKHAFDPLGRCYFSLECDGSPAFYQRKPYGAVFVAAGFHEYSRATNDAQLKREAAHLAMKVHRWIEDPALLGRPLLPGQPRTSKLADVMVMTMLLLELMGGDDNPEYPVLLAKQVEAAFSHHDAEREIFLENVGLNGEKLFDSPEGRLLNPGHSIEMAWFLLLALRWLPNAVMQERVLGILAGSLELGWDKEFGGLYYFMDVEGRPVLQLEATMKLWWPHTEALYAVILAYSLTREDYWLRWLEKLDAFCFRHFVDSRYGEWFGYCDREGNLTNDCKGNHYKGFFHVARALMFSLREIRTNIRVF